MPSNPAPDGGAIADQTHLPETEITLGQLFRQAGYATAIVGKWHLGHAKPEWLPTSRGFDSYFGIPYSNDMRPVRLFEGTQPDPEFPLDQSKLTQRYTDRALAFIEQNRSRPFFLYLPHSMPHKPLAASDRFYRQTQLGLYGDVLAELDAGVGQLFAKLRSLQLDENTFVLFTSDNGPWYGGSTAGLRGMKGSTYEGGHRVPCIARWPGKIPGGHTSEELAVTMDIFATVLHVAGIAAPQDRIIDGRNLLPLFTSTTATSEHQAIVGAQGEKPAFIRDSQWKLHVLPGNDPFLGATKRGGQWTDPRGPDGTTIVAPREQPQPSEYPGAQAGIAAAAMQLFDLKNDPAEQVDVAKQHPDIVARLRQQCDEITTCPP
jgi:uncharacterized sulfatase